MKYVQLIFSPTGGTRRAADALTKHWACDVETVDLSDAEADFSKYMFKEEDVVLIAMPSFGGRAPAAAVERLNKIHGNSAACILVCVYGNRAYEDTLAEMEDGLLLRFPLWQSTLSCISMRREGRMQGIFHSLKHLPYRLKKSWALPRMPERFRYRETVRTRKQAARDWCQRRPKTVLAAACARGSVR